MKVTLMAPLPAKIQLCTLNWPLTVWTQAPFPIHYISIAVFLQKLNSTWALFHCLRVQFSSSPSHTQYLMTLNVVSSHSEMSRLCIHCKAWLMVWKACVIHPVEQPSPILWCHLLDRWLRTFFAFLPDDQSLVGNLQIWFLLDFFVQPCIVLSI